MSRDCEGRVKSLLVCARTRISGGAVISTPASRALAASQIVVAVPNIAAGRHTWTLPVTARRSLRSYHASLSLSWCSGQGTDMFRSHFLNAACWQILMPSANETHQMRFWDAIDDVLPQNKAPAAAHLHRQEWLQVVAAAPVSQRALAALPDGSAWMFTAAGLPRALTWPGW